MRVSGAQRGWPRPGKYGTRLGGGHRTRCCLPPRGRMGLIGCWRAAPHLGQLRRAVRHCCHPQRRAWRRRCRQRSMTGGHAIAHGPVRAPGRGSDGAEAGRSNTSVRILLVQSMSVVSFSSSRRRRLASMSVRLVMRSLRSCVCCSIRASRSFGSFDGWDAGHCRRRTSARHAGWGLGEGPGRDCFGRAARRARRGQTGGSCLG